MKKQEQSIKNRLNYNPKPGSFPYKTILYLHTHGESANADIRYSIGLDQYSIDNSMYGISHSNYYFGCVVDRLIAKGIIIRTKRGFFKLADGITIQI